MDPARVSAWIARTDSVSIFRTDSGESPYSAFPDYEEEGFYYNASERGNGRKVLVQYRSFTLSGREEDRMTNVTVKFQ